MVEALHVIVIVTQANCDILDMSNRIPLDRHDVCSGVTWDVYTYCTCAITGCVPQDGSALNPR